MSWIYYGRKGSGSVIFEIYRLPENGIALEDQPENFERLHQDGSWIFDENDIGIWNEMMDGWFSEESDRIPYSEVKSIVAKWNREGWPV